MKVHAYLAAVMLYATSVISVRIPVQKVRHSTLERRSGVGSISAASPSSHNRVLAATGGNGTNDKDSTNLHTINDMIYIANVTLGGNDYVVQLDTGSSDLWVKGPSSPLPNSSQTSIVQNLTYGIGWAYGHVAYTAAEFAGISIPKQAYLDTSSASNPALTYGTSGILGLGFTSLSTVDALVNKTGDSSGRSILYNLFNDNPSEPNSIAFSMQRSLDATDDIPGTFMIGEFDPDYTSVNNSKPISTFPVSSPRRWTVLLDALLNGNNVISVSSNVPNAPSNRAVVLIDSGTSYSYAPTSVCQAIYGNIPGASFDSSTGFWNVPCNVEVDLALQFAGQVFPLHPLDITPASLTSAGSCIGSFVPQDTSSVAAGNFDWILGDNFLRSVYSVYDFGDFDASGNMGNPYIKLLSLVNPNDASADFADKRGSTAKNNITYNAADSTPASPDSSTISLSNDVVDTIHKVSAYFPAILAIMALNALVLLVLVGAGVWYMCRKQRGGARSRKNKGRSTPMPLGPLSATGSYSGGAYADPEPAQHVYEPVSMAFTDDTFVPPSPAFAYEGSKLRAGKTMSMVERPNSVA
ncbi:hypothetical protein EWM64_g5503 [Hericium alpestre]|uniref:Peptidase A1 domain-containing protein n=1 Tax=Hericium alpestre TaxID=135208 RepID=A0A4Y9ZWU7_9AGAM|nr:hypothetical protein EWM64_g5503 [Hericium alpestre]